jgi:hypothetical protein
MASDLQPVSGKFTIIVLLNNSAVIAKYLPGGRPLSRPGVIFSKKGRFFADLGGKGKNAANIIPI